MIVRYELFSAYISNIYRSIQRLEREEMIKYGLTGAYAQYLVAMKRHPDGITISELSEACDKDKAAVSRVIANMEKKELVKRQAQNNTLYRAPLFLTEQGQQAADYITKRAKIAVQKAGEGLSELERQKFYYALGLISSNLETIYEEGLPES